MKRPSKSFEIALSGVACALSALALTLGSYVDVLLAAGYLLAVFALMVPLSKEFVWGNALAFIGASLLAFLFNIGGILRLVPFMIFFGLHPLVNFLQKKYVRKLPVHIAFFLVKALWFDGVLLFLWFVLGPVFGLNGLTIYPYLNKYLYFIVFFGGTLLFAVYDYMIFLCQRSVNAIVRRIRR